MLLIMLYLDETLSKKCASLGGRGWFCVRLATAGRAADSDRTEAWHTFIMRCGDIIICKRAVEFPDAEWNGWQDEAP